MAKVVKERRKRKREFQSCFCCIDNFEICSHLLMQNVSKGSHLSPPYRCLLAHGMKASCLNVNFKKVDINFMKTYALTEIAY